MCSDIPWAMHVLQSNQIVFVTGLLSIAGIQYQYLRKQSSITPFIHLFHLYLSEQIPNTVIRSDNSKKKC